MDTAMPGVYDAVVVGAGPAGLAAGITLSSEGRDVLILEKSDHAGGQIGTTSWVENYPGFSTGFSGKSFVEESVEQSCRFGCNIRYRTEVQGIEGEEGLYFVRTSSGAYVARTVLLALGLQNRGLGVPGEDLPQVHRGMNTNALECRGGEHVVLIGGGNSAGQAAVYYLNQGVNVTFVVRRPLSETMSAYLFKQLVAKVAHYHGSVRFFKKAGLGGVLIGLDLGGGEEVLRADCVHVFTGMQPATEWLQDFIDLDRCGAILTDRNHQTSKQGVFAVGDVESGSPGRLTCAIGDANRAVKSVHRYLDGGKEREHAPEL